MNRFRSIPLTRLPDCTNARRADLQFAGRGRPRTNQRCRGGWPIVDLGDRLGDFHETAAIVRNLDLVITCDSAPAHLAGALGVPV